MRQSTAVRMMPAPPFNVLGVEKDIAEALRNSPPYREPEPVDFAQPTHRTLLPDYVEHRDNVNAVGKLSAEAVVVEYEAAAKEVEAMGTELTEAAKRCEAMTAAVHEAIAEIKETAARYREEGKRIFLQIEDCALMTAEVRTTCTALKDKIAAPSS